MEMCKLGKNNNHKTPGYNQGNVLNSVFVKRKEQLWSDWKMEIQSVITSFQVAI